MRVFLLKMVSLFTSFQENIAWEVIGFMNFDLAITGELGKDSQEPCPVW